jgi:hypothetical protein
MARFTTGADGCAKAVADAVREARADYVIALEGSRGPVFEAPRTICLRRNDDEFMFVPPR